MRPLLPLLSLLLGGCGDFGLAQAALAGGPMLQIDPDGEIRFEQASPSGRESTQEVTFVSSGGEEVHVAGAWVESTTNGVFYTNEELPFPKSLDPGTDIPINIHFAPSAQGTFHGLLVIEVGTDGTLLERELVGQGCRDAQRDGACD